MTHRRLAATSPRHLSRVVSPSPGRLGAVIPTLQRAAEPNRRRLPSGRQMDASYLGACGGRDLSSVTE